jgi:hypothetical protein
VAGVTAVDVIVVGGAVALALLACLVIARLLDRWWW